MGVNPSKQKFDEEFQNKLIVYYAAERGIDLNKPLKKSDFDQLQKIWAGLGTYYGQTTRTSAQSFDIYQKNLIKVKGDVTTPIQSKAQVAPAPTQTKAKAAAISQPVKSQSNITTLSMPTKVSSVGGQSQGGGGGGGSAPPPPSGGSPSVPFLPAGNVDNFLVLYSKMVYNIVDG